MTDAWLRTAREVDLDRQICRSDDLVVEERGQMNYHCAACGTLLIRHAGTVLPDVVVICPVCLELNEPLPCNAPARHAARGAF